VVQAEDREGQTQQALHAATRLGRILVELRRHKGQDTAAPVPDEVGTEQDAGLTLQQERVVRPLGPRRPHGEEAAGPPVRELAPREYLVEADLAIHEWRDFLKIDLPSRRISTIGGFVLSQLGHVPQVGEQVRFRNLLFTVESLRGRRIGSLRVKLMEVST
jgi:magnesium and cobalt transporter